MKRETRLRVLNNQIERLRRRLAALRRTSYRYSWIRIAVFVAVLAVASLAFYAVGAWLAVLCLAAGAGLFGWTVYLHRRANASIDRHQTWLRIKSAHVARATLDWEQIPIAFHHRPDPEHPFELDLDLVGPRSLHRLLDTAVSHEGSQRLRAWLATPIPDPGCVARRQNLVRELVPLHLFRDRLALNATLAAGATRTWKANQLVEWFERYTPATTLRRWLILFSVLTGLNVLLFAGDRLGILPPWWQVTFPLYLVLWLWRVQATDTIWDEAMALEGALRQLSAVFGQLESFSYHHTPHLQILCVPFLDRAHRPSAYLGRVVRAVTAMSLGANPLLRFLLNVAFPWDSYFAYSLERTKAALVARAPAWLDVWFDLEALGSLANFAYLNPGYAFPDLLAMGERAPSSVFQAEGLGHPFIPHREKICNDLSIPALGQVTVLTGSNMAGKSVFLKTVGVNLALTQAGGPVNARSLQTVLFRLFTSMRISDSVTDGISYFYAEVRRLKALLVELERDHPLSLLYCIDEIFRGTNNRERLFGSRAYVRALAGQRGLGFIATHDLELAKLAGERPQVINYHFRDHVADGRMAFDYILRPGPSPTTNALTIMELEGLPVPSLEDGSGD